MTPSNHAATSEPTPPALDELLAGVARVDLFRVHMRPTEHFAAQNSSEHLHRHLLWLSEQEQRGRLFLCGPVNWDDDWDGAGMGVLRASDLAEARRLAELEPYHVAGLRQNAVDRWTVNEGSIRVSIDLSSGAGRLL